MKERGRVREEKRHLPENGPDKESLRCRRGPLAAQLHLSQVKTKGKTRSLGGGGEMNRVRSNSAGVS